MMASRSEDFDTPPYYGTKTLTVNRWASSQTKPHVTLLDEAEVSSVLGQQVVSSTDIGWKAAQIQGALLAGGTVAVVTWKSPIPRSATWIDYYISAVGIKHGEAVNISLLSPVLGLEAQTLASLNHGILFAHSYAHLWYRNTMTPNGAGTAIGFSSSLESSGIFPPFGNGTDVEVNSGDCGDLKASALLFLEP